MKRNNEIKTLMNSVSTGMEGSLYLGAYLDNRKRFKTWRDDFIMRK